MFKKGAVRLSFMRFNHANFQLLIAERRSRPITSTITSTMVRELYQREKSHLKMKNRECVRGRDKERKEEGKERQREKKKKQDKYKNSASLFINSEVSKFLSFYD